MVASAIAGGLALGTTFLSSKSSKNAGKEQLKGQLAATEEGGRQFDLTREDFAPFREGGVNSLAMLSNALGINGADPQNAFITNFQDDPGFQAEVDFGLKGVENSLAARGLGNSGRALKELMGFGQLQKRNAFSDRLNRLSSLAGIGQTATSEGARIGGAISGGVQNSLIGAGTARASGFVGQANALNSGAGQFSNFLGRNSNNLSRLFRSSGGGFSVPSGGFL